MCKSYIPNCTHHKGATLPSLLRSPLIMGNLLDFCFGAKAQVFVGTLFTLTALGLWGFYTFFAAPTVRVVFHISMFFGVMATYAIIATGLGFRATERVEEHITDIDIDVNSEPE